MKGVIASLRKRLHRDRAELEVEEELRFHLEMLEHEYAEQGLASTQAKAAAIRRFGNLITIKRRCVAISRRRRPLQRLLKTSLVVLGLTGLMVRILSSHPQVAHIGDTLVYIAISGRLLLYARGRSPSTYHDNPDQSKCSS